MATQNGTLWHDPRRLGLRVAKAIVGVLLASAILYLSCGHPTTLARKNTIKVRPVVRNIFIAQSECYKALRRYCSLAEMADRPGSVLPRELTTGKYSGYEFIVSVQDEKWEAIAVPQEHGRTGVLSYFIDESAGLRVRGGDRPAGRGDRLSEVVR